MKGFMNFLPVCFLLAGVAHSAETSIYGITLGEPFPPDVPECPKHQGYYGSMVKAICFEDSPKLDFKKLVFPPEQSPVFLKNWNVVAYPIDGKIEVIEMYTRGPSSHGLVRDALTEKFGKAKTVSAGVAQNIMGATISSEKMMWSSGEVRVDYSSVWTKIDTGRVEITTKRGRSNQVTQLKEEEKIKPKM